MKSAKRILRGNILASGSLNGDKVCLAPLQYLNTLLRGIDKSPAQPAAGWQLRDGVSAVSQNFRVNTHRGRTLSERRRQMARQNSKVEDHAGGRSRSSISPGSGVLLQNRLTRPGIDQVLLSRKKATGNT